MTSIVRALVLPALALLSAAPIARAGDLPERVEAFLETHCLSCHSAAGRKGGLDLETLSRDLADPATEAHWTLIVDRLKGGEMPPRGAARPPESEVNGFLESLSSTLARHDSARRAGRGRVVLRRLNRVQYENTVNDLLGTDTRLVDLLPADAEAFGFDNVAEALRLSATQIEAYLTAAGQALDAAIRLGPRPQVTKRRFNYLEMPHVKEHLAKKHGQHDKDGNKHQQVFKPLNDALVMFTDDTFGLTLLRDAYAHSAGRYRVRISAFAHQPGDRPGVAIRIFASRFTSRRQVATFDLPTETPREAEAVVRLEEGEIIDIGGAGCGVARDGSNVWVVGADAFKGSGMGIRWVEFEGPLLDSWPPPSVARVFGPAPIRSPEKPRGDRAFEPAPLKDAEDVANLVATFATRAFRRPVSTTDADRYTRLARQALDEGTGFEQAVRRACMAIMTAPEFLFLTENPGVLDDHALASRLSYFLWSTMPDDELMRLADDGKLHQSDVLKAQTDRLLNSPRAAAFARDFCGQWLGLRSIDATTPEKTLYPEFDDLLKQAMVGETEAFFSELIHADINASSLIDSDFAMLNRRIADHYGIPGVVGEHFRRVPLPPGSHRGGVLTQASVLKVTANGTSTSPVVRGAWVGKRLLGRTPQPPPANAGSIEPDTRGATTVREQLAKHRRAVSCAGCHQYIDPPGFALESYDVIGGWRDWYRSQEKGDQVPDPITGGHFEYRKGPPVDAAGALPDGREFHDIDGLKRLLLERPDAIARNLVNQLVTYATGAGVSFADRDAVETILERARPGHFGVRTLVHEIVQSPLFREK